MTVAMRKLGSSDLQVAPLAFGGNVFGWTIDEPTSFKLLDAYVAAGFNFIDTADVYSRWVPGNQGGESETILGNWLKKTGKRAQVVIATKVGMDMGPAGKGLSKDHIAKAVEASLKRLQTDYIDLYQAHQDDESVPMQETLEAFGQLVKQGKVRVIGASNFTAPRLAEAIQTSKRLGLPAYQCLQPHYNLVERALFEPELEPLCLKEGVGVIPYFPLASGFLTGKYRSAADTANKSRGDRVKKYLNPQALGVVAALDQVSKKLNSKPATVALAWLLTRPVVTAPIASATNLDQLQDLLAAPSLELDSESIELLNKASA
jgi:aryl-alcohol dehydrogenase-like predicted oxidoreductase